MTFHPPIPAAGGVLIVSTARLRPAGMPLLRALLPSYVDRTRAEPGCLSCQVYLGHDDSLEIVFMERWADTEAVIDHLAAAHMTEFQGHLAGYMERPPHAVACDAA